MPTSRNAMVVVIVLLTAGLAIAGYALYKENKQPESLEIKIGDGGISIEGK